MNVRLFQITKTFLILVPLLTTAIPFQISVFSDLIKERGLGMKPTPLIALNGRFRGKSLILGEQSLFFERADFHSMDNIITKRIKTTVNKKESVFDWVLIAKGIGIVLVVIGHFSPHDLPEYWREMRKIIYSFHMPLFFLLSGFLYSHGKYSYSTLIRIKIKRLIYPFISVAIIFFIIKKLSGIFFYLEHPIRSEGIYALLMDHLQISWS